MSYLNIKILFFFLFFFDFSQPFGSGKEKITDWKDIVNKQSYQRIQEYPNELNFQEDAKESKENDSPSKKRDQLTLSFFPPFFDFDLYVCLPPKQSRL